MRSGRGRTPPASGRPRSRALGRVRCTSTASARARRQQHSTSATRSPSTRKRRRAPPRSYGTWTIAGTMPSGCSARAQANALECTLVDLRTAPRLVAARGGGRQPLADLPGACPCSGGLRERAGLHARRAAAGDGAPVLRLLGLPGDRLLRAHAPATARRRISCTSSTTCTSRGIGVILDWVPSHFPDRRASGCRCFDGTHLYEHEDPRQGFHPEWSSSIFNYGRAEVRNFLVSNALFWLDRYHVDALRVDAVASMLYLDYGRKRGRMDPQPLRRPREPGGRRVPQAAEPRRVPRPPRHPDHRRGIHRMADGVAPDLPRRAGLRAEVEHGLDARHPALLPAGPAAPQVPPQPAHLQHLVRVHGELRAAALAR